ncbi:MAG: hypothetical protein ACR2RB_07510 [Gammaproteobacteria bacterium]
MYPSVIAFNVALFALMLFAGIQGYLSLFIKADVTGFMVYLIAGIFLIGLLASLIKARHLYRETWLARNDEGVRLRRFRSHLESSINPVRALEIKISSELQIMDFVPDVLVALGFLGSLIGFYIATTGISPDAVSNAAAAVGMVSTVLSGIGVVLFTTIEGLIFALWIGVNNRAMYSQAGALVSTIVNHGHPLGADAAPLEDASYEGV